MKTGKALSFFPPFPLDFSASTNAAPKVTGGNEWSWPGRVLIGKTACSRRYNGKHQKRENEIKRFGSHYLRPTILRPKGFPFASSPRFLSFPPLSSGLVKKGEGMKTCGCAHACVLSIKFKSLEQHTTLLYSYLYIYQDDF